jgi:hypothetical protein
MIVITIPPEKKFSYETGLPRLRSCERRRSFVLEKDVLQKRLKGR